MTLNLKPSPVIRVVSVVCGVSEKASSATSATISEPSYFGTRLYASLQTVARRPARYEPRYLFLDYDGLLLHRLIESKRLIGVLALRPRVWHNLHKRYQVG